MMRRVGLDFIFIDTEHIALDRSVVSWMCHAYDALRIAPIVRIPSPDPYAAVQVLDGGARGIVAPYVETAEQVRALAGAVKLRPLKGKRLDRIVNGQEQLEPELADYLRTNSEGRALVVNIESVPALNALDEIIQVPELDAVLIGPHDLSCSLGLPEQYSHPKFDKAVRTIIRKARAHGVGVGVHVFYTERGMDQEIAWAKAGANMILHGGDIIAVETALTRELAAIRKALGDTPSEPENVDLPIV
jgi:4-hydroxy-2-oxoheptanedioate aldolase